MRNDGFVNKKKSFLNQESFKIDKFVTRKGEELINSFFELLNGKLSMNNKLPINLSLIHI